MILHKQRRPKMTGNFLKKFSIILVILCVFSPISLFSQVSYYGGKGLMRIIEAESIYPGVLAINPVYGVFATGNNEDFTEDHSLHLGLTLSLSEQFEVFAQLTPYQDDQKHTWGPIGDTRLSVKYNIPSGSSLAQFGLVAFTGFPTALNHNIPFEPYSDDAMSWGMIGLATFDMKDILKSFPMKISANLGYQDNNWNDAFFSSEKDQLIGGLGLKFPVRSSLIYSEFTGEIFINNANVTMSQNSLRYTQGFRFVGPAHLICDLAADVELGGYKPSASDIASNHFLKDYADWKILFGVTYRTSVFKGRTKKEKELDLYKKEEQKELDQIQEKRKKVVKDLEELRKQLEQEKKPKTE